MSDPALLLGPALAAWLRADTEVRAAFGSNAVKVLDKLPQPNTPMPYVTVDGTDVDDGLEAECLDAVEVFVTLGVWSLPSDGDRTEARRLCAAIRTSLALMLSSVGHSPEFTIAGYRVRGVYDVRTQYLTDPSDGKTIHGVIAATLSIDPT